jgi:DNA polymerase
MTPWQQFVERWKDCRACPLFESRQNIVLARGELPCDVLFVGEAPGQSEDVLGKPFVGPAGQLLDQIIDEAVSSNGRPIRLAWTNLVCCIPLDEHGSKTEAPSDVSIRTCSERLVEFVGIANPRLIVCVGALATDWLNSRKLRGIKFERSVEMIDIVHPAALLRANEVQKSMGVRRSVVQIRNAVKRMLANATTR